MAIGRAIEMGSLDGVELKGFGHEIGRCHHLTTALSSVLSVPTPSPPLSLFPLPRQLAEATAAVSIVV